MGLLFPSSILSAPKSEKHAAKIAIRWLAQTPQPLGITITANIRTVETYRDDSGMPIYYIVHTKPRGFIIVSADDLIEPIIGFFPNGDSFSPLSTNPLGAMLKRDMPGRMEMVKNNSKNLLSGKKNRNSLPKRQKKAKNKWEKLLEETPPEALEATGLPDSDIDDIWVYPFIESRWSQSTEDEEYCYNYYTPNHYVSGCTATAMAQTMRYYQHPLTGVDVTESFTIKVDGIEHSANLRGGDGTEGAYNWSNMVLVPNYSITETERQAIGALLYDVGVSIDMSYTAGGSSASLTDVATSLVNTFGYNNSVFGANYDSAWLNITEAQMEKMINSNLDAGFPVMLGISGKDGGHAILTDGYGINEMTLYHHLNLGWAGSSDGWYNMPNIETTNYNFNVVDTVVYNIFKQGSGEIISGRILDDAGIPIQDAIVTATGGETTNTDTTDSRGIFALINVPSATSFTLTAYKNGYTLSPAEHNVSTATSANNGDWLTDWPTSGNLWGVNFTGSVGLKGDIDENGQVNVIDAILALQVITGNSTVTAVTINANTDVNTDLRIGLAEAIYALQQDAAN